MKPWLFLLLLASCSSFIEERAASSTYQVLKRGQLAVRRLADVELAREAAPGGVVQMAAFSAAYAGHRGFRELHAETVCQYALGFVFDDWEAATLGGRADDAARIGRRLEGLLATCVALNVALLPEAWRASLRPHLPALTRAHAPFVLSIASAESMRVAIAPGADALTRLDDAVAMLTRCTEVAPGLRDAEGEIVLGSLLAGRARFLPGPDGEAQLAAARRLLGESSILVDVMYARSVAVARRDRALFERTLERALAADLARWPDRRLANELARLKALRYRAAIDVLIPP